LHGFAVVEHGLTTVQHGLATVQHGLSTVGMVSLPLSHGHPGPYASSVNVVTPTGSERTSFCFFGRADRQADSRAPGLATGQAVAAGQAEGWPALCHRESSRPERPNSVSPGQGPGVQYSKAMLIPAL
jgi:hypothetical protein